MLWVNWTYVTVVCRNAETGVAQLINDFIIHSHGQGLAHHFVVVRRVILVWTHNDGRSRSHL